MNVIKKISFILTVVLFDCVTTINAAPPVDSYDTWALWHMDSRTNYTDPPTTPWYIPDDDSANPGRTNDLNLHGQGIAIFTPDGVYSNAIYCDGFIRYLSNNDWANSDMVTFDFYFKPNFDVDDLSLDQRLFEISGALSVRFQINSATNYGNIRFYVYDDKTPYLAYSGWKRRAELTSEWNHVFAWVDDAGNFSATLEGEDNQMITNSVSGIDDALASDGRCFVGGSRVNTSMYVGYLDEVKITTLPEPSAFMLLGFVTFFLKRRK